MALVSLKAIKARFARTRGSKLAVSGQLQAITHEFIPYELIVQLRVAVLADKMSTVGIGYRGW